MAEVAVIAQAPALVEIVAQGGLTVEFQASPPALVEVTTEGTQGGRGLPGADGQDGPPGSDANADPGDLILYFQNGLT